MPDQETKTVTDILVTQFILRFGIPRKIHTDQGLQFESVIVQELCKLLDIEKTRKTPFHPQSDGMVGRFNRTLGNMLVAVVASDQRDWDTWQQYLTMAYRSAVHQSTGLPPNELLLLMHPLTTPPMFST